MAGEAQGQQELDWAQTIGLNDFCREFTPPMLGRVRDEGRLHELGEGEELFAEGAPGGSLFLILEGVIELSRRNSVGVCVPVSEVEAGRFMGELSLLTPEGTRQLRAAARGTALVWEVGERTFRELLHMAPEVVARNLMQQAAENFRAQNRRWVEGLVEKERLEERRRVVRSLLLREEDLIAHLSLFAGQREFTAEEAEDWARTVDELVLVKEDLRFFASGFPNPSMVILEMREWALRWWQGFQEARPRRSVLVDTYFEVGRVRADAGMVARALERVLVMALRLAAEGTRVGLRGGGRGGDYVFALTYWQPGMDEFTALRLFEPFLLLGKGLEVRTTWLDLTLAAAMMREMGGSAWLEHRAGEQVTLAFSLPLEEKA